MYVPEQLFLLNSPGVGGGSMTIGIALEAALSCDIKGEGVVTPEPPFIEGAGDLRDAPGGDRMLLKGST